MWRGGVEGKGRKSCDLTLWGVKGKGSFKSVQWTSTCQGRADCGTERGAKVREPCRGGRITANFSLCLCPAFISCLCLIRDAPSCSSLPIFPCWKQICKSLQIAAKLQPPFLPALLFIPLALPWIFLALFLKCSPSSLPFPCLALLPSSCLLIHSSLTVLSNCPNRMCLSLPALHEFPTDLFTNKERTEGAVALHVLCVSLSTLHSILLF